MTDIATIQDYIRECDEFDITLIDKDVQNKGKDEVWKTRYNYIDCTRIGNNGLRLMQTIGVPYIINMSNLIYIINKYFPDEKDDKLQLLVERHKANLEYEREHPPVWYKKGKSQQTKKRKVVEQKLFEDDTRPRKISKAQQKLAMKVAKINTLKFKFNAIKNE